MKFSKMTRACFFTSVTL